jgi:hypothetical protein
MYMRVHGEPFSKSTSVASRKFLLHNRSTKSFGGVHISLPGVAHFVGIAGSAVGSDAAPSGESCDAPPSDDEAAVVDGESVGGRFPPHAVEIESATASDAKRVERTGRREYTSTVAFATARGYEGDTKRKE